MIYNFYKGLFWCICPWGPQRMGRFTKTYTIKCIVETLLVTGFMDFCYKPNVIIHLTLAVDLTLNFDLDEATWTTTCENTTFSDPSYPNCQPAPGALYQRNERNSDLDQELSGVESSCSDLLGIPGYAAQRTELFPGLRSCCCQL